MNKKVIIWIILAIAGAVTGFIFSALKLAGILSWPWFYVIMPFTGVIVISIVLIVAIAIAWLISNTSK